MNETNTIQTGPVDKTAIRNAATVIVLRDRLTEPRILMGQRGAKAAFMPNKFVFPGGAVDPDDAGVPLARRMPQVCRERLLQDCESDLTHALATAAIRELWEETSLILGQKAPWEAEPPKDWAGFAQAGYVPDAHPLQFVFRAITPPGRPRRFDARFFLVDADEIATDLDDFSTAQDELSHLQWIPVQKVREFDLPFITEVVLAEIAARAHDLSPPENVPFFNNSKEESMFQRLKGRGPLSGKKISYDED
ncbi:NUDIX hydrolase [Rhodalgimonas zhirmunskyi]|uniref:NUDIX hydrolase n=1 Tax=Rhodalgimonas zhirmunskyi TaxID=2964767 RepID=A0AAJ1U8R8_9RHOB|nr:NUDIX hydrolase [Rhodoalgimonas zhirmunskyi]MDQ2095695.1 NUDIX hydrolase [Rhodoalgimonas zhirmunskyi]